MKNLVSTEWLHNNIGKDNTIIFDCRFDLMDAGYGLKSYKDGHIKNAILINLDYDLAGEKQQHGGRHPLPEMEKFKDLLENSGVNNNSNIVIYDDGDLAGASRLWWMMKYIGIDKVYILSGGIKLWKNRGYDVTTEETCIKSKGKINLNIQKYMEVSMEHVRNNLKNSESLIIDSRSKERYLGLIEPVDSKSGHIPGAKSFDWQENFKGGLILDVKELKKRFNDIKEYKEIIVHCGSGITGCVNILALDEVGIDSKLYVGSWSDWSSYEENPINTTEE